MAKTRRRKAAFTALLDPEQARTLDELSARTRIRKAEIVRRRVDMAIAELEERLEAEELGRQLLERQEASDGKR